LTEPFKRNLVDLLLLLSGVWLAPRRTGARRREPGICKLVARPPH
jgi:hypothetical protein